SHELWSRRFGADPATIGGAIEINGSSASLIGVMPPGFKLPLDFGADGRTEVYTPLATDAAQQGAIPGPAMNPNGGSHNFFAVARLAPGASASLANGQLRDRVAALVRDNTIAPSSDFRAFSIPVNDLVSGEVRQPILILLGAVTLVLLIACANVAGLLLVRGERRRRELAVRTALGAGHGRLVRLLFVETSVLAVVGALAGVVIAWLSIAGIKQLAPPSLPRVADAAVDPTLLGIALAIASLTAILTGILPSLQARGVDPADELRESGHRASAGRGRVRWRQTLVTAEIALAVVLAASAGLLVRSVRNLLAIDPGFDPRGVLTMRLSTPSTWYGDSAAVAGFWSTLTREVGGIPGVQSVGAVRLLPLATEMGDWGMLVEGYTPPPNQGTPGDWQIVVPGGLESLGYRLVEGRLLEAGDDLTGPLAMVVNRAFVDQYLDGRSALGTRVKLGSSLGSAAPAYRIVGVVENARHNTLKSTVKPGFYVTVAQFARAPGNPIRSLSLVMRTDGDPTALIAPVRAAVRRVDPRLPISEVRTMESIVDASIAAPHFAMRLLSWFGAIALGLAAIGIFGIVSHAVAVRRQEFGIRAALGAQPTELLRAALGPGLRQTAAGIAVGTILALGVTGLLRRVLEGVSPTDPLTFAIVILLTGSLALIASLVPALRAARVAPGSVLRSD
ncbi:MAG: ADOP family duplicated permease, partial [Gemmatimonadales bacterium]